MKGIVFTEFLEMVENRFSADMVDDILTDAVLPSQGVYTAVGTYDHAELVTLVKALADRSSMPVSDLIRAFGYHLFGRFEANYPGFFQGVPDALTFLSGIEDIIHAEVLKLYPDAQVPRFDVIHQADGLDLVYRSSRHFEELAHGLIEAALARWGGGYSVARNDELTGVRFQIRHNGGAQ